MKYLDLLKPFYYEQGIDSVFWTVNEKSRYLMLSNLYRYNTNCLRVFGNFFHPMDIDPKGYSALKKTMDYEPIIKEVQARNVDSLKIYYFEQFIRLTQETGIPLVCCVSPYYKAPSDATKYNVIKQLCVKYQIPFLFYGADSDIINNKLFFQDRTHLNDKGARFYTGKLVVAFLNSTYKCNTE